MMNGLISYLLVFVVAVVAANVREDISGTCGSDCRWTLDVDTGKLTVSGTGAIEKNPKWLNNATLIKRVEIIDGIDTIGSGAFKDCRSLSSVSVPDSVTTIKDNVFWGCKALTSFTIPETITFLGTSVFRECTALSSMEIPKTLTSIGFATFSGCTALTSVKLPNTIVYINNSAFHTCSALTKLDLPESVTTILISAFNDCSSLTSVTLPKNLVTIGRQAFHGCRGLTSIKIPKSVVSIGAGAFGSCVSLTSIDVDSDNQYYKSEDGILLNKDGDLLVQVPAGVKTLRFPKSVTIIEDNGIDGCQFLESVGIPNGISAIGTSAFFNCSSLTTVSIPESVTLINQSCFNKCTALSDVCYSGTSDPGASSPSVFASCTKLEVVSVTDKYKDSSFCGFQKLQKVDECATITPSPSPSGAELSARPAKWLLGTLALLLIILSVVSK